MKKLLPDLFEGHAPITLQNAFHEALEAFEGWREGEDEPLVSMDGFDVPISHVLAGMSDCTDLLPLRTRAVIETIVNRTLAAGSSGPLFADGVMLVMPLCVERLATSQRPAGRPLFEAAPMCCAGAAG